MLGKLLKHEFRAAGRILLPIWAALLVLGLFSTLADRVLIHSDSLVAELAVLLLIVLFAIGCVAAAVMAIVTMVLRFQQSMLSREGYLTHTLPVSVHQLIWSRMIVALVYLAATILVIIAGFSIAVSHTGFVQELLNTFRLMIQDVLADSPVHGTIYIVEVLVMILFYGLSTCLMFYTALSIGHSFANHKTLLSVVFYFVLYCATQILALIALILISRTALVQTLLDAQYMKQVFMDTHLLFLSIILIYLLLSAIYYILTTLMLKRRLNLA